MEILLPIAISQGPPVTQSRRPENLLEKEIDYLYIIN